MNRRAPPPAFLSRLAELALSGGSVAIIGKPTAVAIEPTPVLVEAYSAWLNHELDALNETFLTRGFGGMVSRAVSMQNEGAFFHRSEAARLGTGNGWDGWHAVGLAAQRRAALVLATVGCGWDGEKTFDWS